MVKIQSYSFSDYKAEVAQQRLDSRSLIKKIVTAIKEFFGIKEGSALTRALAKNKFYGKNLQTYRHDETAIDLMKNFFAGRAERQENAIRKEGVFKEKVLRNLDFIKQEAANCRAALSASKGKLAQVIDVKSPSELIEIVERSEELRRALDQLSSEIKMFPELVFGSKHSEFLEITSSIEQAGRDLSAMRDLCSGYFSDLVYSEMKQNLEELKTAESPEEKQAAKQKMEQTELFAQSKAFLLNEQDRKFLNEVINVASYLVNLAPKSGLLDLNATLGEILTKAADEIRSGPLAELEGIEDLEVLQRAVSQLDRRIDKLALQMNFVSNLLDEESCLDFTELLKELRDSTNAHLDKVINDRKTEILFRMNAFNAIENRDTPETREEFLKLEGEVASEIDRLEKLIAFAGVEFVTAYSGSVQELKDDIEYKGWLIQNRQLTFFATEESELLIGMDKYPPMEELPVFAESEVFDHHQEVLPQRGDAFHEHYFEAFEAIKMKVANLHAISTDEELEEGFDQVVFDLTKLNYSLMEAIILSDANGFGQSAVLHSLLDDVESLLEILKTRDEYSPKEEMPPNDPDFGSSDFLDFLEEGKLPAAGTMEEDILGAGLFQGTLDSEEPQAEEIPYLVQGALKELNDLPPDVSPQDTDIEYLAFLESLQKKLDAFQQAIGTEV